MALKVRYSIGAIKPVDHKFCISSNEILNKLALNIRCYGIGYLMITSSTGPVCRELVGTIVTKVNLTR